MFENKLIHDVHKTRYIVSWLKAGGLLCYGEDIDNFRDWLLSLNLTDDEVQDIVYLATNGKLELESSAKKFINNIH